MIKNDVILFGDVYAGLESLPNKSISVAITSPPYWQQRDYGFEGQIGQESTPEEYMGKLCSIFDLLKEKLKDEGVFFLNIGDKYFHKYGKSHLLQIPYRLAFHMSNRGWILENIVIWFKPNHMPSSVKDRFANTYEPILVFTKSRKNIYKKKEERVIKINLQQTPWSHTAVFPEKLVETLLNQVSLKDGDVVLDPFAGTGTVAKVVRDLGDRMFSQKLISVMIEKGEEFIDIIKERARIKKVIKIKDVEYDWNPVEEVGEFPKNIPINVVNTDKYGEVYIANNSREFISILKGISTEQFQNFHREDALYFFGVKNWNLMDLYYSSLIFNYGYVLRNMLVISDGKFNWYPIFMFAKDTTKIPYKFYIDRVRVKQNTKNFQVWEKNKFIGSRVRDISGKKTREGIIIKIVDRYKDDFPKMVLVQWEVNISVEFVLHPEKDEILMESLRFYCPQCGGELKEPYDPLRKNLCPNCEMELWTDLSNVPLIKEPDEIKAVINKFKDMTHYSYEVENINVSKSKKATNSKFMNLDRINWGASPGARKIMLGEYFTKMRLYRIDQPLVAQYLTLFRKHKRLTIEDIKKRFPKEYTHTVGHWFRKDFGGSVPIPEDINRLKEVLGVKNSLLEALERTALKFQTVKNSIKGKNPGDFLEYSDDNSIKEFLQKLYLPSYYYFSFLKNQKSDKGFLSTK